MGGLMTYEEESTAFEKGMLEGINLAKEVMLNITRCDCERVSRCENPVMLMGRFNNALHSALIGYQAKESM
jgi:hypothetical protein